MPATISHLQFNVRPANLAFYRDLLSYLGWSPIYDGEEMLGVRGKDGSGLWFTVQPLEGENNYDGPGLNHLAIGAESPAEVDAAAGWLREHGVPWLFETPRHRPDFAESESHTYYQVMFESADRIL
ncbi:MAG TPA: hypothetical protein VN837_19795, partial [Chloroflexota bacterium]|nr:hypothetical protein [Chloroflexota bacterium]